MPFSKQYAAFRDDKYNFFQTNSAGSIAQIERRAKEKSFKFLSDNKNLIEQEFKQLYAVLSKDKDKQEEFWLYCYYCCAMLEAYYLDYRQPAKVEEYCKLRKQIASRLGGQSTSIETTQTKSAGFVKKLGEKVGSDLKEMTTSVAHASKLRGEIGLLNLYRLYWTFCRLTLTRSFQHLAKNTQLLELLSKWINRPIDVDNVVKQLEIPNEVLRFLSVGFFASRFIINAGTLIKHTFVPSDAEKEFTTWQRFTKELSKRHPEFLNDFVWGTVNALTNFNEFSHIPATTAGWITAGFLLFDVALLLWRRHLAEREYLLKKAEYKEELNHYENLLINADNKNEILNLKKHCDLIKAQQQELELTWQASNATFLFNTAAAVLFAAGFSAAMVVGFPVLVPVAYAACTVAAAMYLSDSSYNQYKDKKLRFIQAQVDNAGEASLAIALKDYQDARNDFILTIAKNAVLPALTITMFAICWEAALVFTAVYMTYKLYEAYEKHKATKPTVNLLELQSEVKPKGEDKVKESEDDEHHGFSICYNP
ncbi:hypothetical protein ACNVED_14675 [Legionella sp. D16C41]|uniref:hypothetical protein n=1 Tax=Legionella sp. D16C41 TaxID=3402688 RepID=UPI003AF4E1BC